MGRPEPCILFAHSFIHSQLDEYVDEVVFAEPVVITACEFLEQNASPSTPNISLIGATSPPSFALEVFVHCEGESRFRRLSQPFLYSHSSSNILEVEAVVTSHLVLRGSYRSLTLVVYGNTAEDLGQFNIDFDLDNSLANVVSSPCDGKFEDLPPPLCSTKFSLEESLSSLGILSYSIPILELTPQMRQFLLLVMKICQVSDKEALSELVKVVVSVVSSYVKNDNNISNSWGRQNVGMLVDNKLAQHVPHLLADASSQLCKLYKHHQSAMEINQLLEDDFVLGTEADIPSSKLLMDMFHQCFPLMGKTSVLKHPHVSQNEGTIFVLGVSLFFCSSRDSCFHFVCGGGMDQVIKLLCCETQRSMAITLLLLRVVEAATRYGIGCEGFLGWWPREDAIVPIGNSSGYCNLLKLILNKQRHDIASLATYILQRLGFYEITCQYESTVLGILANLSSDSWITTEAIESLVSADSLLKQILKLVKYEPIEDPSPAGFARRFFHSSQSEGLLSYGATFDAIVSSQYTFVKYEIDAYMLSLMKERGFFLLSAALLSSQILRSENGKVADIFMDIAISFETILLSLLFSRSGLTFLLNETEAISLLMCSLQDEKHTSATECLTLRQAAVFLSKGFFCRPQDVRMIAELHLRVGVAIDRLLTTNLNSDDLLWVLWELCDISRSEPGRQAILSIANFPEAVAILIEALHSFKSSETIESGTLQSSLAIFHSASEILEVLVADSTSSSLTSWIGHSVELQKALCSSSPGSNRKDAPTRLLGWVDAGVVYYRNGAIGLLRYAAVLASGGDAQLTSTNGLVSDAIDAENIVGDSAMDPDTHVVDNLLGKLVSDKYFDGTSLHNNSIIKLTTSFRILAFISENSAVAASLYEEGAVTLVYVVLINCKSMLERLSSSYDHLVDEGAECNSTSDLLLERSHEQSIIDLLIPTLILLMNLLKKLKEAKEQHRNKKLLNALLRLHREVRLAASSADLSFPCSSSALGFSAVCHLLASTLACWPVFGWTPGLFHRLLESVQATSILALGPKDACSLLCLLGDLLPMEDIWQWRNEMPRLSVLRALSVGTILGPRAEQCVNWYLQPEHLAVLLVRLTPQLERIAELVLQFAFAALVVIQDMLRVFIVRVACQGTEYAITLLRPIMSWLDTHISQTSLSDTDMFKVHKLLNFIASLLEHPCAKTLLLEVGILQILEKTLKRCGNVSQLDGNVNQEGNFSLKSFSLLSWCQPAFKSLALIFSSGCFHDDVSITCSKICFHLLKLCEILPVGRELLACIITLEKLSSCHQGRSVITSVCFQSGSSTEGQEPNENHPNGNVSGLHDLTWSSPFLNCLKKLLQLLDSKDSTSMFDVETVYALAFCATSLLAEGSNSDGLPALKSLFGLPTDLDSEESPYAEKFNELHELVEKLEQRFSDDEYLSSSSGESTLHQVKESLKSILMLLESSAKPSSVLEGITLGDGFNSPSDVAKSVTITSKLMQLVPLTSMYDAEALSFSHVWNADNDVSSGSFAEKFVWECPDSPPDRQITPVLPLKRKQSSTEGTGRRLRDNSGSEPVVSIIPSRGLSTPSVSSGPTRRDTFRQRKPNTSRPPSMHVDDYVARERNIDNASSATNAVSTSQRGSGRPPSIHVDEFMARQRERQNAMPVTVGDLSQVKDASQVRISSLDNPDKLQKSRHLKTELDDDLQEIDIVFDEEPETDDSPFLQPDDNLQPAHAVVGEGSPGSVVEESEGDTKLTVHLSHAGTPPSEREVPHSEMSLRRSASRTEIPMTREPSPSQKNFGQSGMDRIVIQEQSDESKYASPIVGSKGFDMLPSANPFLPPHLPSVASAPSSQSFAPPNYYQRGSPQKGSNGLLGVGFQGYPEQKLPVNQPPLPPMPPPSRPTVPAQTSEAVQSHSSPYVHTVRDIQPPLPSGFPLQVVSISGIGLHHTENAPSVGNNSVAALTASQPTMDSKYPWNMPSSGSKLQAENFSSTTSIRPIPPLPPLPPPFSSPMAQSSAANSSPQASFFGQNVTGGSQPPSHSTALDSSLANFPPGGGVASFSLPQFSPSLMISRPSLSGTVFNSATQQHAQNSSSLSQTTPNHQTNIQLLQPRPPPPPPPQLPRPPHPPQHSLPPVQVSQSEQAIPLQNTYQVQMQSMQIPQQLQIPQLQFYYQHQQQEPLIQTMQPLLEQTQPPVVQSDSGAQQQMDPGMTLQQYFSSPEAIQSLLSDRDKLCQLLEQHPKLMQMLQERLGQQ
ncbi:Protein virilizer protein [Dioscorea alata]|uniref:Protein virilizer protein n=1 Tax=Dioscorea alata TaxID=55571 RepID=A0ACB7VJG8_DIOAL|nr:Protein virilizer protein [Dioscorea alata]